jgi:hypothetical protein
MTMDPESWGQLRVNLQKLWILASLLGAADDAKWFKIVDQQIRPPLAAPVEAIPSLKQR